MTQRDSYLHPGGTPGFPLPQKESRSRLRETDSLVFGSGGRIRRRRGRQAARCPECSDGTVRQAD